MAPLDKLNAAMRRIQTLESRLEDMAERLSIYESGSEKNPNTALYLSDGRGGKKAKIDFDSSTGALRIKKVD
ncbi:MAG: hypothetical protein DRP64_15195 [Verrucomicrobia bacterium]|nr:MAG: hypothetical protein DRP64_15195 [Verrucomicrobiota bacterium]